MDKERKKYLKKQGIKLVEERSKNIKKLIKDSNPADITDPAWSRNHRKLRQLQQIYDNNRNEVYSNEKIGVDFNIVPINMDLSKEYVPVQSYYLHCKKCHSVLPMNPETSIRCQCGCILFDLKSRRKYIEINSVEVVKL